MPAGVSHSSLFININENKMNADDAASLGRRRGVLHHRPDQCTTQRTRGGWGGGHDAGHGGQIGQMCVCCCGLRSCAQTAAFIEGGGGLVYVWNLRQQRRKTPSPPELTRKRLILGKFLVHPPHPYTHR